MLIARAAPPTALGSTVIVASVASFLYVVISPSFKLQICLGILLVDCLLALKIAFVKTKDIKHER